MRHSRGEKISWAALPALIIVLLFFFSPGAWAHKLNLYAEAKEGLIIAEGYYAGGDKAKDAAVLVYENEKNALLREGRTDSRGFFSFPIPAAVELRLVLKDRSGHRDSFLIAKEEIQAALPPGFVSNLQDQKDQPRAPKAARPATAMAQARPGAEKAETGESAGYQRCLSREEIELLIGETVEKKLAPVLLSLNQLKKNEQKARFTEIIGGLGYIAFLFGLVLYFKARLRTREGGS